MRNFFQVQKRAKKLSNFLVFLYALAVLTIILAIYTVSIIAQDDYENLWNPLLLLKISCSISLIIFLASYFKYLDLKDGGKSVALMLGGKRIQPDTKILSERQILNIVEEIAIAAGVSVPPIYLLPQELGINAFAAGFNTDDAIIAISQGALELLTRDELQGVVAHEFSHILNADIALNIRLIAILYGIIFIAQTGQFMFHAGLREVSEQQGIKNILIIIFGLVGLSLLVIGYVGVVFAKLIKSAISRQREYLADASAIEFTRHPIGLAGALKKIFHLQDGASIKNYHAEELSHLFFADAINRHFKYLFSTHPPILKRILKLDPAFTAERASVTFQKMKEDNSLEVNLQKNQQQDEPFKQMASFSSVGLLERSGTTNLESILKAKQILNEIPKELNKAIHDPYLAQIVVYLLLLSQDQEIQNKQLAILSNYLISSQLNDLKNLTFNNLPIPENYLLPIVDLILPTLEILSPSQLEKVIKVGKLLIEADLQITLTEYVLEVTLLEHLERKLSPRKTRTLFNITREDYYLATSDLLLCLAVMGSSMNREVASNAYQKALNELNIPNSFHRDLQKISSIRFLDFKKALAQIALENLETKEQILQACLICIQHDKQITNQETLLTRVIAFGLDLPVPLLSY